jgi:hypothetical protein
VTTLVLYKYRAPGSSKTDEIKTETWPSRTPKEVLPLIGAVGDTIKLRSDYPEEYRNDPKDYWIDYYQDGAIQFLDDLDRTVLNMVLVIVTDPRSDSV